MKNRAAITLVLALIKISIVAFSLYGTSHILIKNMIYYYITLWFIKVRLNVCYTEIIDKEKINQKLSIIKTEA